MDMMLEVKVTLDFVCCSCGHTVNVLLKCAGKGLAAGARAVAAVRVRCPTCQSSNQLLFEPCGIVRAVAPCPAQHVPEPSLN
jgi:hypothetical protein